MFKRSFFRFNVIVLSLATALFSFGGSFFVAPQIAYSAAAVYTNNEVVAGTNLNPGMANVLAMDMTLPAADADVFLDGDGSDTTGAGAQEGPPANGTALIRFVLADNVCVTDADGGAVTPPVTRIWVEAAGVNEANCGVDNETEVNILGAAGGVGSLLDTGVGASTRREIVHRESVAVNGAYNRTAGGGDVNDEDIYRDEDESLFYNAGPLDAVTVRNVGTAVTVTDILAVSLWTENTGNAAFGTDDLILDANCAWDAADDWVCEGVNPGDTLVLYTGLVAPRAYVTINMTASPTANRTVQMRIPALVDGNVDGNFDAGDAGVFFSNDTANNGLHDSVGAATNTGIYTIVLPSPASSSTSPDTTPPSNVSALINNGDAETAIVNVSLKLTATDAGWVQYSESATLTGASWFRFNPVAGTTYMTVSFALSAGDGNKVVYARFMDDAGNMSAIVSDNITLGISVVSPPANPPSLPPSEEPEIPGQPPSGQVTPESSTIGDGDLLRAFNSVEVYVTKKVGATVIIRHIVNPRVFDSYGHFGGAAAWGTVKGVDTLGSVYHSAWVRGADGKVWEVNADGTKHWMNMTWEQFADRISGGDSALTTNLVFEVNDAELALYTVGANVRP